VVWFAGIFVAFELFGVSRPEPLGEAVALLWFVVFPFVCFYGLPLVMPETPPILVVCGANGVTVAGEPVTGDQVRFDKARQQLFIGDRMISEIPRRSDLDVERLAGAVRDAQASRDARAGEVPTGLLHLRPELDRA
jgi:hypothetical protein